MSDSLPRSQTPQGKLPEGIRIYAIGDVHGRIDLLDRVLSRIDTHLADNPIATPMHVFLGDYVDRGPASRSVLDCLIECGRSHSAVFLKGNHEAIFTEFFEDPLVLDEWRKYGGLETLASYGLRPTANIITSSHAKIAADMGRILPSSHRTFLAELKTSFTCGDYFFVHAGVRPGIALEQQEESDLLWIREDFLKYEERFGKIIVHGHTPVAEPEIRANRINIDTGAYATGKLTCLVLESDKIDFI